MIVSSSQRFLMYLYGLKSKLSGNLFWKSPRSNLNNNYESGNGMDEKNPFMAVCEQGYILNQYGWKLKIINLVQCLPCRI
jgi:hypothetical protein